MLDEMCSDHDRRWYLPQSGAKDRLHQGVVNEARRAQGTEEIHEETRAVDRNGDDQQSDVDGQVTVTALSMRSP